MTPPFIESYLISVSPLPLTSEKLLRIDERINSFKKGKIIEKLRKEESPKSIKYVFIYQWLLSGIDDKTYDISKEYKDELITVKFNIDEVATYCSKESIHMELYRVGMLKITWSVPSSWRGIQDKAKRVMERVMADLIWRPFEKEIFSHDLFNHPSQFMQGFSMYSLENAMQNAALKLNKKYSKFVENFKIIRDWKNIYFMKEQVQAYLDWMNQKAMHVPLSTETRNSCIVILSNLSRLLEIESITCMKESALYELSDEI